MGRLGQCKLLEFCDFGDERGKLVVIEGNKTIPFEIKRIFYIYNSDKNVVRGKHANKKSEFVLVNVSGTSKVRIDDGFSERIINLNRPMMGLYIPSMIWKDMYDFSQDSVLLVLSNTHYDNSEYIREYEDYIREIRSRDGSMIEVDDNGLFFDGREGDDGTIS